jgi:hypothetical protein
VPEANQDHGRIALAMAIRVAFNLKASEQASEAPTPKPLPLGYGKRCLPSALDAIAQVFIESVGSELWWRCRFAEHDVADLRCSPAIAAGRRDAAGLKLRRNTAVGVNASCSDIRDSRRKQSSACIGPRDDRLSGCLAGPMAPHERQMSLNGSGLIAVYLTVFVVLAAYIAILVAITFEGHDIFQSPARPRRALKDCKQRRRPVKACSIGGGLLGQHFKSGQLARAK